jgi:putative transposase
MPRIARVVIPGLPHHVTQRGNDRQPVFFGRADRSLYLGLLRHHLRRHRVQLVAWCLMTNHVHLVATPADADGLKHAIGRTHWKYTQEINRRLGRTGHLWQGRFFSAPVEDERLSEVVQYVERNPVRAGMVARAEDHAWSSARAHCTGHDSRGLVDAASWARLVPPKIWRTLLGAGGSEESEEAIRRSTRAGRPLAEGSSVDRLERLLGRPLRTPPLGRPRTRK